MSTDFIKMQNYFRALCLARSLEVIYAEGWSSEGCAQLPGAASISWLVLLVRRLSSSGRKEGLGSPQSPCLFLLKKFSCPHSSDIQLLGTEPLT